MYVRICIRMYVYVCMYIYMYIDILYVYNMYIICRLYVDYINKNDYSYAMCADSGQLYPLYYKNKSELGEPD